MTVDERYMQLALDIAEIGRGQTSPNPLVGAVVVKDDFVVGQGAHLRAGQPHAEVNALRMAGDLAQGATIYVTLEPCNHHGRTPPCTDAILQSGIRRVVVAAVDHDARTRHHGIARLRDAGLEVVVGVMETQAARQNRAFFHRIDTGRPLVVFKSAATFSGHIAASNGHSQFVTGESARQDVQALRLQHRGIAVGVGTVIADNPRLTVRSSNHPLPSDRQPVRVIFDSHARTPVDSLLLREPGQTLIFVVESADEMVRARIAELSSLDPVEAVTVPALDGRIHLEIALTHVANRGINSLLLEGGSTLAAAFLEQQLVDEVCIYLAPKLLQSGMPIFNGVPTGSMGEAVVLEEVRYTPVGDDMRVDATVRYCR